MKLNLIIFNLKTGKHINSIRDSNFIDLKLNFQIKKNYLWLFNKSSLFFIKLNKQKIFNQLDISDFKNSKLQISENRNYLFLVSEKKKLFWKLNINDLRIFYRKEISGCYQINFINNFSFMTIIEDLEFDVDNIQKKIFFENDTENIINNDTKKTFSLIIVTPDIYEQKNYCTNKGVIELIRTDKKIIKYNLLKKSLKEFEVVIICEDNYSCKINFTLSNINDNIIISNLTIIKIFTNINSNFILNKNISKKIIKKLVTDEFFESNIQV